MRLRKCSNVVQVRHVAVHSECFGVENMKEDCNTEACKVGESREKMAKSPHEILAALAPKLKEGKIQDLQLTLLEEMELGVDEPTTKLNKITVLVSVVGVFLFLAICIVLSRCRGNMLEKKPKSSEQPENETKQLLQMT